MKIKGFLFDVDGVLFDSIPQHAKSWVVAFKEKGFVLPSKYVYIIEGMPDRTAVKYLAELLKIKLSDSDCADIIKRKVDLFNGYKTPKLIKGSKQLLTYLKKKKFKVRLVTGSSQNKTLNLIKNVFGISRKDVVTGQDVKNGKPFPDPYLMGLKKIKLPATEVIVIENAPLGIQSAKSAGLKVVALKTGLISIRDLKKCKADLVFKNCAEILKNLSKGTLNL